MPGQLSTHDSRLARGSRAKSGHCDRGIRNPDVRAVLPRSGGVRFGNNSAHQESEQVWPVSVLAGLLTPFAGPNSSALASQLLVRFGTLDRMLSASDEQIVVACEDRADIGAMIAGARALVLTALHETVTRSRVDAADPAFERYLSLKFRGRPHEELHAIFVDQEHGFISEELVSIGSVGRVDARISSIMRRSIELGAAGLYLVHNHPSKVPNPSPEDVRATKQISTVATALEITIIDHLIIAGNSVVSMRELKLL